LTTNNPWKIATLILTTLALSLFLSLILRGKETTYELGDISISASNLNTIGRLMSEHDTFQICDMEQGKCVTTNFHG